MEHRTRFSPSIFLLLIGFALAEPALVILSNGALAPGWKATGWNGLEIKKVPAPGGKEALLLAVDDGTKAWPGAWFETPTAWMKSDLSNHALVFTVNGSEDSLGTHVGGQAIQVSLTLGGKSLLKGGFLPLGKEVEGGAVDVLPQTRQRVVIPLSRFELASEKGGVDGIRFQYRGQSPKAGITLGEIMMVPIEDLPESKAKAFQIRTDVTWPEFADLPPSFNMPKGARVEISPKGRYLMNGEPRFFTGVQVEADVATEAQNRPGYDPKYRWIYDEPLRYETAQRMGIDAVGQFFPSTWTRKYLGPTAWAGTGTGAADELAFDPYLRGLGLPVYVDMTCENWTHGILTRGKDIPEQAKSDPKKSHFLRYHIVDPEGIALYEAMAESIVKRSVNSGAEVLFYEIFNEPAWYADDPVSRRAFAAWLEKRYKNVDELNRKWGTRHADWEGAVSFKNTVESPGLSVDFSKFNEDAFLNICRILQRRVKEADPRGRTCVQVMGGDGYRNPGRDGVNIFSVSKAMDVVCLPTSGAIGGLGVGLQEPAKDALSTPILQGEGILTTRFFQNAAGGTKPLHDGEFYGDDTPGGLQGAWHLQFARGLDASFLFKWDKRAWDWKTEEEGKSAAEKWHYLWLNPYAKTVENLRAILQFKEEMKRVETLWMNRSSRQPVIGFLMSQASARAQAASPGELQEVATWAAALGFSHWDYEVVMEEELNPARLARYRAVILAGAKNLEPRTPVELAAWVKAGGLLVMGGELPRFDEYERPLIWEGNLGLQLGEKTTGSTTALTLEIPRWNLLPGTIRIQIPGSVTHGGDWKVDGTAGDGRAALLTRDLGKGRIHYLHGRTRDYHLAAILGSMLTSRGIPREWGLVGTDGTLAANIECHGADLGEGKGYFLFNWDLHSKWVTLRPSKPAMAAWDPVERESFEADRGGIRVLCGPQTRRWIFTGDREPAGLARVTPGQLEERFSRARAVESQEKGRKDEEVARKSAGENYPVDVSRLRPLDLRPFANRQFVDQKPGDGVGGWTDEGGNSLKGVPDGLQNFLGVTFDVIRWDMNQDRSCIVLGSARNASGPAQVIGIPVGEEMKSLFFLQAVGWADEGKQAATYRVRYADGQTLDIPVVVGKNTADWWITKRCGDARVAFMNQEKKGFYAWRWTNPRPAVPIQTLDLVSSMNDPIPIVVAITGERGP